MNPARATVAALSLSCVPLAALDPKSIRSLWQCDDSLNDRLIAVNALAPIGFLLAYTDDEIRSWPSRGLAIPALSPAQQLVMLLPGGGNGGPAATYLNQWTLVMDVKVTVAAYSNFTSLLQTTPHNNNDVDFFITPKGALGLGPDPSTGGIVIPGTWYRIALSCGNDGAGGPLTLRAYLDGQRVLTVTGRTYNGAYALEPTALLFSDDNGETQPVACNSVAFWRQTLPDADIAALGGPAATGITPFVVTHGANSGPGSLRQAVVDAAALPGADVVLFSPSAPDIRLSAEIKAADADGVTLDGSAAPSPVTLRATGSSRLFLIPPGTTLSFRSLTLAGGRGGGETANLGGAARNDGTSVIQRCTFTGNSTNTGGAIYNGGSLAITRSTFTANTARTGGALYLAGGTTTLDACTFTGNRATLSSGGAIRAAGGTLALNESLVAGNSDAANAGPDLFTGGATVTSRQNLIGNGTGSGVVNGTTGNIAGTSASPLNPRLAPLDHYGGSTSTLALLPGSPARDAAPFASPSADQRGFRSTGLRDIGAYESGNFGNYNAWSWETLPATASAAQHAREIDYDGDSASNREEWAARTDPANPASYFRITHFQKIDPNLQVTFHTAFGRIYTVEHSPDLASWTPVAENIAGTGLPVTITIGPVTGHLNAFVRARVGP